MHKTDVERMRRQVERVADTADEILDDTETIGEAGYDPSQSQKILEKQQELLDELSQALADFNELTNRAESVETEFSYSPDIGQLTASYDSDTDEVTFEWTGETTIPAADLTLVEDGVESAVANDLTTSDTITVDTSGYDDGTEIRLNVTVYRDDVSYPIKPWEDVIGKQGAGAPEITLNGMQLPEHQLTDQQTTRAVSARVSR